MNNTDAGIEYETVVAAAQADFTKEIADSYNTLRDRCQRAWYRYQVRAGIITAPYDEPKESGSNGTDGKAPGPSGEPASIGDARDQD